MSRSLSSVSSPRAADPNTRGLPTGYRAIISRTSSLCNSRASDGRIRQLPSRRRFGVSALNLADSIDHRVESEHGRGVARLEVAYRLQVFEVGEAALGRRAIVLEHLAHGLAHGAQLVRAGTDNVRRHDRGRSLA